MPLYHGSSPITAVYHGTTPLKEIRRGGALVWSNAVIRDPFDNDGFLSGWINELCGDLGLLRADPFGQLVDGLNNVAGTVVSYVEGGLNTAGTLVAQTGDNLIDAYCRAWGGTSAPGGLIGLINGIPIIGGLLGGFLSDWLEGELDITSLLGSIPVVGQIGQAIGLIPNALGQVGDAINYVVDGIGDVIGTITCGRFHFDSNDVGEGICFVIGVIGQAARMAIPDGLMNLDQQFARFRNNVRTPGDDGYLEVQVAELGSPGFATTTYRRYANAGGATGVGIKLSDSIASIVRRTGSNDVPVLAGATSFGPGDRLRLTQTGDTHVLERNGIVAGTWNDNGSAARGANNRAVAMAMTGAKELLGTRRMSPSLAYLEAA